MALSKKSRDQNLLLALSGHFEIKNHNTNSGFTPNHNTTIFDSYTVDGQPLSRLSETKKVHSKLT